MSWKSVLQKSVATSSTMAEVMAANHAAEEGLWIRKLLRELKPIKDLTEEAGLDRPITMWEDNQAALNMIEKLGN